MIRLPKEFSVIAMVATILLLILWVMAVVILNNI